MDGARIWNAMAACGYSPSYFSDFVDSFTVCLSKGLGAPIGSLLIGTRELINRARRLRKALGGGMRQVGVIAAAGMVALDDFERGILVKDHDKAMIFVNGIKDLQGFRIHSQVHTNIVFLDILLHDKKEDISSTICTMLKERKVLVSLWAPFLLRVVIHRDISEKDIEKAVDAFTDVSHFVMECNGITRGIIQFHSIIYTTKDGVQRSLK
jgi:threonine aldolase